MESTKYSLKLILKTPILGSQPGRNDPASAFIRNQIREEYPELAIDPEEVNSLPEEIQKGTTCFYRTPEGAPCMKSYQIKGMLKASASDQNGLRGVNNLKSHAQKVFYIFPIIIPFQNAGEIAIEERPMRGMTAQGPRTSLSRSEKINDGAFVECTLEVLKLPKVDFKEAMVRDILDYGRYCGLLQWRNSGIFGNFDYELVKL